MSCRGCRRPWVSGWCSPLLPVGLPGAPPGGGPRHVIWAGVHTTHRASRESVTYAGPRRHRPAGFRSECRCPCNIQCKALMKDLPGARSARQRVPAESGRVGMGAIQPDRLSPASSDRACPMGTFRASVDRLDRFRRRTAHGSAPGDGTPRRSRRRRSPCSTRTRDETSLSPPAPGAGSDHAQRNPGRRSITFLRWRSRSFAHS